MGMNLQSGGMRRRRAPVADINVTPLVDVMLVLLIIFMVTAPMMTAGVPVNLPDSRAKQLPQETKPVEVSIDAKGRVYLGKDDITDSVGESLDQLARARASAPPQVTLNADRSLDYGKVMTVMGELNRVGLNKVALVSKGSTAQ